MQQRAASVGDYPEFQQRLAGRGELDGYDLVVAADGVNSSRARAADFGTSVRTLGNKFAWYGTTKIFPTLTQTFVENKDGTFNAHHYRHSPRMSTFVVRVRRGDLAESRVRLDERGGHAGLLRARVRANPGRASARLEQLGVAQFP